jgi:hypothetical protein
MPREIDVVGYPERSMKRGFWGTPLFCLAAATASLPALAQQRPTPEPAAGAPAQTEDQRRAQEHFQRAKQLYSTGKYSDAIAELEVARSLDPKARDLVMNLGIVHEKLGQYDEALSQLRTFLEMEGVTPAERTKAEGMIKRIEGAKQAAPSPSAAPATTQTTAPPGEVSAKSPPHGRIDALTIAAGSVAIVGLGLGAGLGIYALSSRPTDSFVTGRDGSYATLQQKTDDAHNAAVIADVSLGVGVIASVATAWLYFGRTKDPTATPTTGNGNTRVSIAPGATGGAVLVGGTF